MLQSMLGREVAVVAAEEGLHLYSRSSSRGLLLSPDRASLLLLREPRPLARRPRPDRLQPSLNTETEEDDTLRGEHCRTDDH